MMSSNGNTFRVTGSLCGDLPATGEFPAQRPVTLSFDAFVDLRPNKRLSKQSWTWCFETPSCSLWRHCNGWMTWKFSTPQEMCPRCAVVVVARLSIEFTHIFSLPFNLLTIAPVAKDQRKHQRPASLAFVRRIHRWPVNSPHKRPVMRKMFSFDDVIMRTHVTTLVTDLVHKHFVWNHSRFNTTKHLWWWVNIDSGNGL